ncbi:methyltransferase type 11 [Treponema primitia ZAS-2]|uniref:Methyltransferase type 11 n=1 Tax=Treponema primitia (strain ATCC BAA-887 / DSM 12427 / ZAS-2) TaxID=545694 RepID=F5YH66_TREPZ|nr:class I SAM-dependent methyltransferase [Treponema primitia]AEF86055.1 methyltransferase type 11 [Treponema primitia ZAS-2]
MAAEAEAKLNTISPTVALPAEKARAKALEFDRIADEVFAPIYLPIARRLLELAGISRGRCVDLGCGGGHLGLALAELVTNEITLLDSNPYALELAARRIKEADRERIATLCADVHAMPIAEASAGLVVSRGAMWFWDKEQSLTEIRRILAPGGVAVLGGGYGSPALKTEIYRVMSERNGDDFGARQQKTTQDSLPEDYAPVAQSLGFAEVRVVHDDTGDWLLLRKAAVSGVPL